MEQQPIILTEYEVGDLIKKIQIHVYPRRQRLREFFTDYDKNHCGRCSLSNFVRGVFKIGVKGLSEKDAEGLADHFTVDGPQARFWVFRSYWCYAGNACRT